MFSASDSLSVGRTPIRESFQLAKCRFVPRKKRGKFETAELTPISQDSSSAMFSPAGLASIFKNSDGTAKLEPA